MCVCVCIKSRRGPLVETHFLTLKLVCTTFTDWVESLLKFEEIGYENDSREPQKGSPHIFYSWFELIFRNEILLLLDSSCYTAAATTTTTHFLLDLL